MDPSTINLLAGVPVYIVVAYLLMVTRRDQLEQRKADLELFGRVTSVVEALGKDVHGLSRTIERHGAILLAAVVRILPPAEAQLLKATVRDLQPDSTVVGTGA